MCNQCKCIIIFKVQFGQLLGWGLTCDLSKQNPTNYCSKVTINSFFSCYYFYWYEHVSYVSTSCLCVRLLYYVAHALFGCLVNLRSVVWVCFLLNLALWHCFCLHCDLKHNHFFFTDKPSDLLWMQQLLQ